MTLLPLLLEIKRTASVFTFSIILIWFLLGGSQAALAYSKCERRGFVGNELCSLGGPVECTFYHT